jgi:hypothetical protein
MKIKTIKIKAFISMEIILLLFTVSISVKLYNQYAIKIETYNRFKKNKEKLLILKKYLCVYMKENKSIPPINDLGEIDFNENIFLKEIPPVFKTYNKKAFKINRGNMDKNEILHLTFKYFHNTYKVTIYGHDINIYNSIELKKFFNKEKKSIILINNEHKCSN